MFLYCGVSKPPEFALLHPLALLCTHYALLHALTRGYHAAGRACSSLKPAPPHAQQAEASGYIRIHETPAAVKLKQLMAALNLGLEQE